MRKRTKRTRIWYGTCLLRNHVLRSMFAEMESLGFPDAVVEAIKDGIDCNLYFQGEKVSQSRMYAILCRTIVIAGNEWGGREENMRKQGFLGKLISNLTGERQLNRADRMLKELTWDCREEEKLRRITRIRKIIRRQKRLQRRQFYITLGCGLTLAVIVVLWGTGVGKKVIKESSAGTVQRKETNTAAKSSEEETKGTNGTKETNGPQSESSEPVELLLTFTGDCILGTDEFFAWDTGLNAYYELYGASYFMDQVRDIFQADDLTVVNMEGTLTEETTRLEKQFAFKGEPEFVDILVSSSVEAANVANNHSHDYGEQSFFDTVNILEQKGIRTFGYDETAILPVKGVKVGLFGIYELDDHLERIPQVKKDIAALKEGGADIIVAVFHWGNELETVPDENQVTLAHLAIDEGADLVVGHHPHVLQGIDTYKGKTIAYSLGNFCFGGNTHPTETDTMIFQQKFVLDAQKKITDSEINVIPCSVSSDSTINNYQPMPLEGAEAERVMKLIEERSEAI
ncbi:MAG: CapA family protein [Eubacteriales bacterium]|nr:CapA family protein [Eubacteriales bacterium]